MDYYLPIIIKFVLGLLVFILQINLTGKGNLAPSTALDAVQNYVLGGIIGGVIYNENITILQFVMVLIIWTIIVLTLRFFKDHVRYPLISDGQLNVDVLELINQDEEWLIGKLNKIGYKDLSEIYIAEYVNGDLRIVSYPK
ncbi:hypothetical protein QUW30_02185 [Ligilactobacillus salivarius]|uniref:YetF domain-containing protein n=1 Tax=Ligilactobacillus salivarius TaxID=1624 RepID=UPI0025A4BE93|nr:YetF domain-containing protein [Ligilactobacillus salivarius]MDM8272419.1 hypothetical protein [Ligilactobacillus salivarius]